jgi:PEP-CTERM motif
MTGVWIPSLRAVMLFAMVIIASLGFAAANITTGSGIANGDDLDLAVSANANPDTPGFDAPNPDQQAMEMRQNPESDDREPGTWLLMTFGLGAVAFALRCRRSERAHYQFV